MSSHMLALVVAGMRGYSMVHGIHIGFDSKAASYSSCVDLGLMSDTQVQHCPGEATGSGKFVFRSQVSANPIFRVRLAGPSIELLDVVQNGMGVQEAEYKLCKAGTYHVEMVLLFADFSDPNDEVLIKKNHPCIEVAEGAFKHMLETEVEINNTDLGSECLMQEQFGIWVEEPRAVGSNLEQTFSVNRTILWKDEWIGTIVMKTQHSHGHLQFRTQAKTCVGQRPNKAGLTKKRVCVAGDSQSRNLVDALRVATNDLPDVWVRKYCDISGIVGPSKIVTCFRSGSAKLDDMMQAEPFPLLPNRFNRQVKQGEGTATVPTAAFPTAVPTATQTASPTDAYCTDVIVNFGQWQLGWPLVQDNDSTYSIAQYATDVVNLLQTLTTVQETEARVYWGTMNTHGFSGEILKCPPEGYRWPHLIERYNEAAKHAISKELGDKVGIIDNFRIAVHLSDLTFDGAHYKAPVGRALAENVIRCLDD